MSRISGSKSRQILRRAAGLVVAVTLSSGCATVGTDRRDEAAEQVSAALPGQPDGWAIAANAVGPVQTRWIDALNDATLVALVAEAQVNNPNLQVASAGVDRARALVRQAGAALSPQVGVGLNSGRSGNLDAGASGTVGASLDVSWELDLWGRLRSGRRAAVESAAAAEADYQFAQHSLAASVARAYFVAIEARRQNELAAAIVEALEKTQRIVRVQYENGEATQQDLSLIKADVASARESLATAAGSQRDAQRSLELLLGRYPGAELEVANSLPAVPAPPPAGLPSSLLERRPDLIAAERRIAGAINGVDQAKAARLPQVALSGSIGGASNGLSSLLSASNVGWQAAGSLLQPIIDGGARRAQVELATADQEAALAAYVEAALAAFRDVETSLDQGVILREREAQLDIAVAEATRAFEIAQLRYQEGETGLVDVLNIQQRVFSSQSSEIAIERALLDQFVTLNLALGGDWR